MTKPLIKKRFSKRIRFKALPDLYEGEGPCQLQDAYEELTRPAFAVWVRISAADPDELKRGLAFIAKLINCSRKQSDLILYELENKGFIARLSAGPCKKITIFIIRKPIVPGGHGFIRFGGV